MECLNEISDNSLVRAIKKSYIVCSTGRSGSSLLCKTLGNFGDLGHPQEYFHPDNLAKTVDPHSPSSFCDYYLEVLAAGTTANGIFGLKIHWHHFRSFLNLVRKNMPELAEKKDLDIVNLIFPNPIFIHISRKDILRQAISTCIAHQTNVWGKAAKANSESKQAKNVRFAPLDIYRYKTGIELHNQAWNQFFDRNSLHPYRVTYEDVVAAYGSTIRGLYHFIGLEFAHPDPSMPTKKQANQINERWVTYYNAIPEGLIQGYSNLRGKMRGWLELGRQSLQ